MNLDTALDRAREVSERVLKAEAARVDAEYSWPERGIRSLQAAGLGGLVVPAAAGGLQLGLYGLARVCEVLAHGCPSCAICFGMHCVGAAVISAKATDEQRHRYLVPIAQGKHLTTLALSEPGTGVHFYLPETSLKRLEGEYELHGEKSFVTNGGHADSYVVSTAPVDPGAAPGAFSCFVVDAGTPGVKWRGEWSGWGMRGNSSIALELNHARAPQRALLGSEGDELWYVFNVVAPYFLVAMSGTYLGIAGAALELAREHLSRRHHSHSGRPLSGNAIVQHRVGTLWAEVERLRSLIYDAALKGDAGAPDSLLALCSAKAEVGSVERIVSDVMTLLGGAGYGREGTIHKLLRDARAAHVMAPPTDLLRVWTGRAFLGLPILGD